MEKLNSKKFKKFTMKNEILQDVMAGARSTGGHYGWTAMSTSSGSHTSDHTTDHIPDSRGLVRSGQPISPR